MKTFYVERLINLGIYGVIGPFAYYSIAKGPLPGISGKFISR